MEVCQSCGGSTRLPHGRLMQESAWRGPLELDVQIKKIAHSDAGTNKLAHNLLMTRCYDDFKITLIKALGCQDIRLLLEQ